MNFDAMISKIDAFDRSEPCFTTSMLLALDEAACLNQAAETLFDSIDVAASLILRQDGGTLDSMPDLMQLLRAVCRKDLALGLGYVLTTFMAATNIWVAGSASQRQQLASMLRTGEKIAIAYHELEHGNDMANNALSAQRVTGGYLLNGCKSVINNIDRAGCIVLQARTSDTAGSKAHSLFLIDKSTLEPSQFDIMPRFHTQGVRSCQLAGICFKDCFISEECLLGEEGNGFGYALRAFQITRSLLPGISLGSIDSALDLTIRYTSQRQLYGASVLDIPHARATIAESWLDYYLADSLCHAAASGLHWIPEEMSVLSSLCKFSVPQRMRTVIKRLALVLGSRYYLREGEVALFEKIVRDYPVVSLGHASSLSCQAAIVPQLPQIFRKFGQLTLEQAAVASRLFGDDALPQLEPARLRLSAAGKDLLFNSVLHWPQVLESMHADGRLNLDDYRRLSELVTTLHRECIQLCAGNVNPDSAAAFASVQRYALLVGAMAAIGRWCGDHDSALAGEPGILIASLDLSLHRLHGEPYHLVTEVEDRIISHLVMRQITAS